MNKNVVERSGLKNFINAKTGSGIRMLWSSFCLIHHQRSKSGWPGVSNEKMPKVLRKKCQLVKKLGQKNKIKLPKDHPTANKSWEKSAQGPPKNRPNGAKLTHQRVNAKCCCTFCTKAFLLNQSLVVFLMMLRKKSWVSNTPPLPPVELNSAGVCLSKIHFSSKNNMLTNYRATANMVFVGIVWLACRQYDQIWRNFATLAIIWGLISYLA